MIAHLVGRITEKFDNHLIIDVHDVGYELFVPMPEAEKLELGTTQKFYTFHSIRENGEDLYGFSSLTAKKLFELLLSVNGVGPKAALAVLSLGTPADVRNAIALADTAYISKAPGIGKKSAERIIVDLRDKVGAPDHYGTHSVPADTSPVADEALDALIALGFPLKEASVALANIDPKLPTAERVRLALKH